MRRDALLALGWAVGFAGVTAALAAGGPLVELDLWVQEWAQAHRPAPAAAAARVLNRFGQGGWLLAISLVLAGWLGWRRRRPDAGVGEKPADPKPGRSPDPSTGDTATSGTSLIWRGRFSAMSQAARRVAGPVLYVVAAAGLVVPTVLVLKWWTDRGAPSSELPREQTAELFGSLPPGEYAVGYPGGHAVNTIVWYGVLLLLVSALRQAYGRPPPPRPLRIVVRVVPPVVVVLTTAYLSYHWLTDSLAGLLLGLAIDRVLALLRAWWWE